MRRCLTILLLAFAASRSFAAEPYNKVALQVNEKLVKLWGAGGFRGAESFGTGIIISPQGHILTSATPLLDGRDLRLHLADGRRFRYRVVVIEPAFDAAVCLIEQEKKDLPLELPFFDVPAAGKAMNAQPGDWVMALSNMYKVAERDEMMSVQRAMITNVGKLTARRGVTEIPFDGEVLYLDTITNNPGAAGGALVTRNGELLGLIGKEFRNLQTETWVNYAMPLNTKAEVTIKGKKSTFTLYEFVEKAVKGEWVKSDPREKNEAKGPGAFTGIVFVPRVVERTPPYVEEVVAGSPAAKAGLQPDDLIVYFDGEPVYSIDSFLDLVKRYTPGDKIQLEIRRGERLSAVTLELGNFPKK